jgi:hypothetical protein
MAQDMHDTTIATLSHLEARLLRIEHVLHGHAVPATASIADKSTVDTLQRLEARFFSIVQNTRAYGELLKICE